MSITLKTRTLWIIMAVVVIGLIMTALIIMWKFTNTTPTVSNTTPTVYRAFGRTNNTSSPQPTAQELAAYQLQYDTWLTEYALTGQEQPSTVTLALTPTHHTDEEIRELLRAYEQPYDHGRTSWPDQAVIADHCINGLGDDVYAYPGYRYDQLSILYLEYSKKDQSVIRLGITGGWTGSREGYGDHYLYKFQLVGTTCTLLSQEVERKLIHRKVRQAVVKLALLNPEIKELLLHHTFIAYWVGFRHSDEPSIAFSYSYVPSQQGDCSFVYTDFLRADIDPFTGTINNIAYQQGDQSGGICNL